MRGLIVSCCLCLVAAAPPPAAKPAACPTPELMFNGVGPRPGIAAPHSTKMPLRPRYPASLVKDGRSGTVWVDFIVERDGRLCNVTVKSIDGPQQFADITSQWLATSPFAPAKKNGQPVVSEVKRTYNFVPPGQRH
jgi:protein TonB